jgi:hypothetical protein
MERSIDGRSFSDYASIYEAKNIVSSARIYEFIDEMPFAGTSYYRIKATDLDGSIEYHGVLMVKLEGKSPGIFIFPNPLTGHSLNVSFSGSEEQDFKILSTTGRIMDTGTVCPGRNLIQLNPALYPGVYVIQMQDSWNTGSKLIIK